MSAGEKADPAARLRLALEMFEVGVEMKREKLRRQFPRASKREIDRKLDRWLSKEDETASFEGTDLVYRKH
jgi:hypothetical protein